VDTSLTRYLGAVAEYQITSVMPRKSKTSKKETVKQKYLLIVKCVPKMESVLVSDAYITLTNIVVKWYC